jgi:hypothetical protein
MGDVAEIETQILLSAGAIEYLAGRAIFSGVPVVVRGIRGIVAVEQVTTRGYKSFRAFKSAMGPAGPGKAWHHIVGQTPSNVAKFGPESVHNTGNLMKLPHGKGSIHAKISGYYSSIRPGVTGSSTMTVRQWLATKSYQFQYDFGIQTLKQFGLVF